MIDIDLIAEQLTAARTDQRTAIAQAMLDEGFLGITGEPQVGKTLLAREAAAELAGREAARVVYVDLAGAYSLPKLVARWQHALLRAIAGSLATWNATTLPREFWPARTERAMLEARDLLGDSFEAAQTGRPARGDQPRDAKLPLDATAELARRGLCVLVFDHLEAPLLTPRHPVDPAELLWQVRALAQKILNLHVAVVCAPDAQETAAGRDSGFYEDGRWMTVPEPNPEQWAVAVRASQAMLDPRLLELGRGNVQATLQLLRAHRAKTRPRDTFADVARTQRVLAERCVQHAFTLHRLGGHVLLSIAHGQGAYAATPDARSDDVAAAVAQLRLAGLVHRDPNDSRGWRLVDPLVEQALGEPRLSGSSLDSDD